MASLRFKRLQKQLNILREIFLPAKFEKTGKYKNSRKVEMSALAYRVLAHAEFEAYIEDKVLEVAKSAWESWEKKKRVSRVALCLIAFCGKEMPLPDTLEAPQASQQKKWSELVDVGERLRCAHSSFVNRVRNQNHWIKEVNLLSLLLPVGVAHSLLDPLFLADMDSFGSLRGITAHTSTWAIKNFVDPLEEHARITKALKGFEDLDGHLLRLV